MQPSCRFLQWWLSSQRTLRGILAKLVPICLPIWRGDHLYFQGTTCGERHLTLCRSAGVRGQNGQGIDENWSKQTGTRQSFYCFRKKAWPVWVGVVWAHREQLEALRCDIPSAQYIYLYHRKTRLGSEVKPLTCFRYSKVKWVNNMKYHVFAHRNLAWMCVSYCRSAVLFGPSVSR